MMRFTMTGAGGLLLVLAGLLGTLGAQTRTLESQLEAAGDNRSEIATALDGAGEFGADMKHLVLGMPPGDLQALEASRLFETVLLADQARRSAPWSKRLDDALYRDYVLPYANLDEPRHRWRAEFRARFWPLVRDCKTPGEAACRLNERVFPLLGVKYSTKRRRANQSPRESIEQGMASCTGLSIILCNACRACGIPARLAGVANWKKKRGNHTWVEVWDGGWHHLGAAEPAKEGLDHVWFAGDVAHAVPGSAKYAVWATRWSPGANHFPLVWDLASRDVFAVDSTARYVADSADANEKRRLLVRVRDPKGTRISVPVRVVRVGTTTERTGKSRDESADTNDILAFEMPEDGVWRVYVGTGETRRAQTWRPASERQETLDFVLNRTAVNLAIEKGVITSLTAAFDRGLAAKGVRMAEIEADAKNLGDPEVEARLRATAWRAYLGSKEARDLRADFKARRVVSGKHQSPYTLKSVGERPSAGWPLVIAMHGGGGVPKDFNDSQWRHMQIYYRDRPASGGYQYLALRAPNDSWNGFYDDYVYPLIERLIRQFLVYGDVDPDRIHVIGYSHGGYGVHSIAPKISDRFAAAHASAAAPTDGDAEPFALRNLPFSFMIGAKDTAYGRADRCQKLSERLSGLAKADARGWPFAFQWQPEHGHGGLPDRDHLPRLLLHRRDTRPRVLDWKLTDGVVRHHYWLEVENPQRGPRLRARLVDNRLELERSGEGAAKLKIALRLDTGLVDPKRPLVVIENGKTRRIPLEPSLQTLLETLAERGDPRLARTIRVEL